MTTAAEQARINETARQSRTERELKALGEGTSSQPKKKAKKKKKKKKPAEKRGVGKDTAESGKSAALAGIDARIAAMRTNLAAAKTTGDLGLARRLAASIAQNQANRKALAAQ
jgi:hypothetical protein